MPKTNIGPRIAVDGEEQYRAQIKQIIEQAKTLDAQMGAVTASFDKNTTAEEKAAKTSGILAQQLQTAEKRVDLLRDMVEKSAAATGENSEATLKWKQALYGAEEQANKLRVQNEEATETLENMGDAMEESAEKGEGLGDQVEGIAGKLGVNLPDGAKKALNSMKGLSAGSVAALGAIAAGAAAAVKAIQKLNEITEQAATKADDLMTQSITSGISTDLLQAYQYAAPYIDVSADAIVGANKKIGLSMADAVQQQEAYTAAVMKAHENGKEYEGALGAQAAAFQQLGVSVTDSTGQFRDQQEVMFEVFEALNNIGNQTERNALANDIFKKSFDELAPAIQDSEKLRSRLNEALEEGYVLSEDQLKILGQVDDAHQKYTQTIEKNTNLIAVQWAPTNKKAYEDLTKLIDTAGKMLIDSKLIENTGALVQSTLGLVEAGADLMGSLPGWVNPIQQVSDALRGLAVIAATVADTVNLISGLMPWNWGSGKATTALGFNINKGQLSNLQQLRYGGGVSYNAAGTEYWKGGGTWLGESGAEYVQLPRGSRIYSNQESRAMMGENNTWNITVANIEELDELVDWYQSRQIRGRMR